MLINYCKRIEQATTEERALLDRRDARFGVARAEITNSLILPALLSPEQTHHARPQCNDRAVYFYWWFVPEDFPEEESLWEPSGYAEANFLGTVGRRVECLEYHGAVSWKSHLLHMLHTLCPRLAYAPSPLAIDLNIPHMFDDRTEIMLTWQSDASSTHVILTREGGSCQWEVTYIDPDHRWETLFTSRLHPWNLQITDQPRFQHSAHFNRARLAYMAFYDRGPRSLQLPGA